MKNLLLCGAHVSIAGGLETAVQETKILQCRTMQIFTKNNRQWQAKPLAKEEIDIFKQSVKQAGIDPVIGHAAYLINLGSSHETLSTKSRHALETELKRCCQLSIPYLVLHPGSAVQESKKRCLENIILNINMILEKFDDSCTLVLELMSGQGSTACSTFEELSFVYHGINKRQSIGFCIDTCHAWASGYDFSTQKSYDFFWEEFDKIFEIKKLKVIHMNDSQKGRGSHIDRHEAIGRGTIGLKAFGFLMNDERFFNVPKIIETPRSNLGDHRYNIEALLNLLTTETRKKLGVI